MPVPSMLLHSCCIQVILGDLYHNLSIQSFRYEVDGV